LKAEIHSELSWTTEIIDIDEEELETILARASRTDYHVVEVVTSAQFLLCSLLFCRFTHVGARSASSSNLLCVESLKHFLSCQYSRLMPPYIIGTNSLLTLPRHSNNDRACSFARKHSVHSYPKIAIFKGGDLHSQYEGSRSFDDLCDFITKHTGTPYFIREQCAELINRSSGIAPVSLARENEGEDHKPDEMNVVDSENSDPLRNSKFEPAFDYVLLLASSYLVLLVGNRLYRFLSSQRTDVVEHEKQE